MEDCLVDLNALDTLQTDSSETQTLSVRSSDTSPARGYPPSAVRRARSRPRRLSEIGLRHGSHRFRVFTEAHLEQIEQLQQVSKEQRFEMRVVSQVLPFRVNQYVIDELIDWTSVPDDPIFQLTFPQRGMLCEDHYDRIAALLTNGASKRVITGAAEQIRRELNPHPAGQQHNVPSLDGEPVPGLQHKYEETVLLFPAQGQTCHSFCSFCFRWPQFAGDKRLKFATNETDRARRYLAAHPRVTDLLVTGGDPLVMKTKVLKRYLEMTLDPSLDHIQNVRLGTKSLTFWPQRFVTDADADGLLRLIERLVTAGKHVALMAHLNHWRELESPITHEAIRRIRSAGAVIRAQGPLLAHVNDDADVWVRLWNAQLKLGVVPYYMFVERDTGARCYFEVPLAQAYDIYRNAINRVTGLARTVRGPSMSADPGKVEVQGITEIAGEKVFVLRFVQGRDADWVQRPFFAKFNPTATWLNHLEPAFGESKFFFES